MRPVRPGPSSYSAACATAGTGSAAAMLLALPVSGDRCWVKLFFEPFRLMCPMGHGIAGMQAPDLADLAGGDLLLLEEGHRLRDQALSLCANAGQEQLATSPETLWNMKGVTLR